MSQTPSPIEVARLQDNWDNWLSDTCEIWRDTLTQDEYGEVETPVMIASNVPCGVGGTILPGVQQLIASRQAKVADAVISMPYITDIEVADIIHLTSQGGRQFEVLYVPAPSNFESGMQAYVREVQ